MNSSIMNVTEYNFTAGPNNTVVEFPFPSYRVLIIFILWFACGFIGNSLAIVILYRNRLSHRWKIFYKLVFLLSLSDLIAQTLTLPIMISQYLYRDVLHTGAALCDLVSTGIIVTSLMSVLFICLMSLDRLIATWFPVFYKIHSVHSRYIYIASFLATIISVLVGILPIIGLNTHKLQRERTWCFVDMQPKERNGQAFFYICATIGISAVLFMLTSNGLVVYKIYQKYKKVSTGRNSYRATLKQLQAMTFLLMAMVVFIASWIYVIIRFLNSAIGGVDVDHQKDKIAVCLTAIQQVSNPWLYIVLRESLFARCLKFGRNHTREGSVFNMISNIS